MTTFVPRVVAWIAAALVTGVLASLVQTQFSLAELLRLGTPIPMSLRWLTTLEDAARFAPVMGGVGALALVPALLVARVTRGRRRLAWTAVTGAAGMGTALWLMASVIPMPPIAGSRTAAGLLAMAASGLAGGAVYAGLTAGVRRRNAPASGPAGTSRRRRGLWAGIGLALTPVIAFLAMFPWSEDGPARVDPARYAVQTVLSGLERPWSLAFLPDGRLLVTEMQGRLRTVAPDGSVGEIAFSPGLAVFQQRGVIGLMEVAVDPAFARNGWVYLTMGYGAPGANGIRLVRGQLQGDTLTDLQEIYRTTPKEALGNNGGRLAFLPDGTILMTVGDGNLHREAAQVLDNDLGAVVRLDRDGQPLADNPFRRQPGAQPALFSVGHRNAQGIAVDAATGEIWLTEHGPRGGDEINRVQAGRNYGWPVVTGGIDYPFARVSPYERLEGFEAPVLEWTPSIAPAGLAIYDGELFAGWQGDLLVPALRARSLYRVKREAGRVVGQERLLSELGERLRDVRVAPDGALLVLTDGPDARLLRVTPRQPGP